jgi:hypothetical protein
MLSDPAIVLLMYFVLPVWLAAGFADYLCHRATSIETTTGAKESVIHLLLFAEMAVPLLAVVFLEVNALVIALMLVAFLLHEATALWDVSYAVTAREVTPIEQHVHSFLEMMPLMAALLVISRHFGQFLALFGLGSETARFDITLKQEQVPATYVIGVLAAALLFEILPYIEEFVRGWRANHGALVPEKARRAAE